MVVAEAVVMSPSVTPTAPVAPLRFKVSLPVGSPPSSSKAQGNAPETTNRSSPVRPLSSRMPTPGPLIVGVMALNVERSVIRIELVAPVTVKRSLLAVPLTISVSAAAASIGERHAARGCPGG